ncbi:serine hydrolase domain-containing protein [Kineococcus rhizosphaerae]|uniref:Beta-lactamase n=1 Tax=Kineococcus rhizosphaerae TaxID=559628 RepID=A0A2T0R015_9ACTN|nr:serine hydrolase domain-containing protein [Kineococcus rhizosphaerae]PRY12482.1 beta-lactamase [Kineococcus rhizosphaerae]
MNPADPGDDLTRGVHEGLFRGAAVVFSGPDGRVHRASAGTPADHLGPLTRAVVATLAHELAAVGALDLDRPTDRGFTARQLLDHASGLPATSDVWRRDDLRPAQKLRRLLDTPLVATPGREVRPSPLGFVVLGDLLEEATGQGLDSLLADLVTGPLRLTGPVFGPGDDEVSRALRRPVGHTGLLGRADDVHAIGRALLDGTLAGGPTPLLHPAPGACLALVTDGATDGEGLTRFWNTLARRLTGTP